MSGMDVWSLLITDALPRESSETVTAGGVGGADAFKLINEIGFIFNVEIVTPNGTILIL